MKKLNITKTTILTFVFNLIISFVLFEIVEHILIDHFGFKYESLSTFGIIGYAIFLGFKYHIICCLFPIIYASYQCRHKKCKHEYCNGE
jgi:hypothetical protein